MSEEKQQSSVKPWKEWQEGQSANPQFGILSKLNGVWVNWKGGPTGLHTTPMPSPGTSSETIFGVFHFKAQEYREQLRFTQVNAPVRNRAGSNEQFNGAVKYETAIVDNQGDLQHFENGMYLWLGDNQMPWQPGNPYQKPPTMFSHRSDANSVQTDGAEPVLGAGQLGPQFVPPHSISRSGVIPHGTTIHLTGNVTEHNNTESKEPPIAELWQPEFLSVSATMGINLDPKKGEPDLIKPKSCDPKKALEERNKKPDWTKLSREKQAGGGVNSGRAYFEKIFNYNQFGASFPYTVQPNLKLIDANRKLIEKGNPKNKPSFGKYNLIELDSVHPTGVQGAVANNVMIERYCRVARMRFRMWLEEIVDERGNSIDQLQYEQIVDFEFMFGSNGETTLWPHIQVNTLRREQDIPIDERLPPIHLPTKATEEASEGPEPVVCSMNHTRD